MPLLRFLFAALALVLAAGGAMAQAPDPAGRWALRSGDRTLLILELRRAEASEQWEGTLFRPAGFAISPGAVATLSIDNGAVTNRPVRATVMGTEFAVVIRNPEGGEGRWRLTVDGDRAVFDLDEAVPTGISLAPLRLARAYANEQVATDLSAGSRFVLSADLPSNPELRAIFEADQADRQPASGRIDWTAVGSRDAARRARAMELLEAGALHSGDDFWHAAFVFQHGGKPNDYLLAHTLAMAAIARGRPDATWIAAATLDRYLQNIGQPQVYGTQFSTPTGQRTTQESFNRTLISDRLRTVLGVPPLADQEAQRARFEAQARAAENAPQ